MWISIRSIWAFVNNSTHIWNKMLRKSIGFINFYFQILLLEFYLCWHSKYVYCAAFLIKMFAISFRLKFYYVITIKVNYVLCSQILEYFKKYLQLIFFLQKLLFLGKLDLRLILQNLVTEWCSNFFVLVVAFSSHLNIKRYRFDYAYMEYKYTYDQHRNPTM